MTQRTRLKDRMRRFLPIFMTILLGCAFSLSAAYGKQREQAQNKPAAQKDENAKTAEQKAQSEADAKLPAVLWGDPGDIGSLDLVNGAGGAEHAPRADAKYTFIKEDTSGTSAKFYVKDDSGVQWLAKVGEEAKPETAASRLVWSMGYFTDEDYFVAQIHVSRLPKLHRGGKDIGSDGTVTNVRLKRQGPGLKKSQNWDWYDNPFLGTREFNGLRVMMALINNWDLTTVNSKVYPNDTQRRYLVSDLGASMGRTGAVSSRSKGVLKDYDDSKFIRGKETETVSFEMRTRPLAVFAPFEIKNYAKRSRMKQIADDIPVADAKWIGSQLAQLSPQQIRDAFRSAGYSPEEVEGYARAVEKRIADLKAL